MKWFVIFGDLHAPYTSIDALTFGYKITSDLYQRIPRKSDLVVAQIGDLYDMYAYKKFPGPRIEHHTEEIRGGRLLAENFWKNVRKIAPKARRIQLLGNHDIRPEKRLYEAFPEGDLLIRGLDDLFKFESVETHFDVRKELVIGEVCLMHGYFIAIGKHLRHNMMNTVHGHTHRGGTHFESIQGKLLWELDCGYMGDPKSKAMSYTNQTWTKWTHGIGIIDEYGPRFCPTS